MQRNSSTKMCRNCVMVVPSGEGFLISSGFLSSATNAYVTPWIPRCCTAHHGKHPWGSWAVVHTATGRATECHRAILNYLTILNWGFKKNTTVYLLFQQFHCAVSSSPVPFQLYIRALSCLICFGKAKAFQIRQTKLFCIFFFIYSNNLKPAYH